jgi:Fe-S-cluster containining protein
VSQFVDLDHPRFRRAERAIFLRRVTADCMTHRCRTVEPDREKLDACCQYGADTDVAERDAILSHAAQIAALLRPDAAARSWFTTEEVEDADFPSGRHVRTEVHGDGCVFLAHDLRGCAIHRASIEGGWDFRRVKPNVCRLFPLTYEDDAVVLSDDYPDYSCAADPDAPSVYRVSRDTIADVFGPDLVRALDIAEAAVLAAAHAAAPLASAGRLRVVTT